MRAAQAQAHHPQGRGRKQDELQGKPVPGARGGPLAAPELERAPAHLSRARERRRREGGQADAGGDAQRGQGDPDRHPGPELRAGQRGRPDPADRECQRERHEADHRELVGGQKERLPAGGAAQLGERDLARPGVRCHARDDEQHEHDHGNELHGDEQHRGGECPAIQPGLVDQGVQPALDARAASGGPGFPAELGDRPDQGGGVAQANTSRVERALRRDRQVPGQRAVELPHQGRVIHQDRVDGRVAAAPGLRRRGKVRA